MTENEAMKILTDELQTVKSVIGYVKDFDLEYIHTLPYREKRRESLEIAIKDLEEIQRYRAIGTVDECKEAVEQLKTAKEAIRKLLCSEYGSSCQFCIHDEDEDAICCNVGGSGSWCCENAEWNGRDS